MARTLKYVLVPDDAGGVSSGESVYSGAGDRSPGGENPLPGLPADHALSGNATVHAHLTLADTLTPLRLEDLANGAATVTLTFDDATTAVVSFGYPDIQAWGASFTDDGGHVHSEIVPPDPVISPLLAGDDDYTGKTVVHLHCEITESFGPGGPLDSSSMFQFGLGQGGSVDELGTQSPLNVGELDTDVSILVTQVPIFQVTATLVGSVYHPAQTIDVDVLCPNGTGVNDGMYEDAEGIWHDLDNLFGAGGRVLTAHFEVTSPLVELSAGSTCEFRCGDEHPWGTVDLSVLGSSLDATDVPVLLPDNSPGRYVMRLHTPAVDPVVQGLTDVFSTDLWDSGGTMEILVELPIRGPVSGSPGNARYVYHEGASEDEITPTSIGFVGLWSEAEHLGPRIALLTVDGVWPAGTVLEVTAE